MKSRYTSLCLITTVVFATILTISITISLLQSVYGVMGDGSVRRLYSGPRASVAVSGNNVYLTWWDNKTGNNEVFFASSNDNGKNFAPPINLSNAKGGSADSQITAQGNNVYVTWWDNKTGDWHVFSRASADGGKTFGDSIMLKTIGNSAVKTLKAPPSDTISVDTVVATSGNNEYVAWWDNTTGNWEVSFVKSSDGGKTFDNAINLSNSSDARSVGARMAAEGNNVYVAWMEIKPGEKHVMIRTSIDNGQTFSNAVTVNK